MGIELRNFGTPLKSRMAKNGSKKLYWV